jgi:hypothetical protein
MQQLFTMWKRVESSVTADSTYNFFVVATILITHFHCTDKNTFPALTKFSSKTMKSCWSDDSHFGFQCQHPQVSSILLIIQAGDFK